MHNRQFSAFFRPWQTHSRWYNQNSLKILKHYLPHLTLVLWNKYQGYSTGCCCWKNRLCHFGQFWIKLRGMPFWRFEACSGCGYIVVNSNLQKTITANLNLLLDKNINIYWDQKKSLISRNRLGDFFFFCHLPTHTVECVSQYNIFVWKKSTNKKIKRNHRRKGERCCCCE